MRAWLSQCTEPSTVRRALASSAVVGVILTLVNHGELILGGRFDSLPALPVVLTFFVPYVVATVSSVAARRGMGEDLR